MSPEKIQYYISLTIDWAVRFLPNFISAILFLVIGWWVIGKIDHAIKIGMEKKKFEVSLSSFLRTLFTLGSKTILVIMIAGQLGFQTTSLAAMIGAVGLAVGLALQGSLANLAGGVLILLFKPYKVGDVISTSGFTGKVKEIQIFNTILILADNKTALLPNGNISNGSILNNNKQPFLKFEICIRIPTDLDFNTLSNELKQNFYKSSLVLQNPEVVIHIKEIRNGKMYLTASIACLPSDLLTTQTQCNLNLLAFYKEKDIDF